MTRNKHFTQRCAAAVTAFACVALMTGCTSFKGERLAVDADKKEVDATGFPYRLNRPEFKLSRAAGENGKAGKYTLAVAYEPDPTRLYTIRLNPGPFTDSNFILKFGAGGVISSVSATTTEQITPTITALGSFAKDLIGALATGALDEGSLKQGLTDELKATGAPAACKVVSDVVISAAVAGKQVPGMTQSPSVAFVLMYRINAFADDEVLAAQFHYASNLELVCLDALSKAVTTRNETDTVAEKKKDFDASVKAYIAAFPAETSLMNQLSRAVDGYDTKKLEAVLKDIEARMKELLADGKTKPQAAQLDEIQSRAQNVLNGVVSTKTAKLLADVVAMKPNVWLARHVQYLERELADIQLELLKQSQSQPSVAVVQRREALERARADALGVRPQYERAQVLSAFLNSVPMKTEKGAKAPAAAEYVAIRGELDVLVTLIDARRTKVITDGKAEAKPGPAVIADQPVKLVKQKVIDDSKKSKTWFYDEGKNADDYVLVLKEAE